MAAHVSHNSGKEEWYTPPHIILAAMKVFGSRITTDPASCAQANKVVHAETYYTKETNGLLHPWYGKVFVNPPYSSGKVALFVDKFLEEYAVGHISAGIILVNNATETKCGTRLLSNCVGVCFLSSRVKYLGEDLLPQNTPLQGQMVCYVGAHPDRFSKVFSALGVCFTREAKIPF